MTVLRGLLRYIKDEDYRFLFNVRRGMYRNMPDELYLKKQFKAQMGKPLDLEHPVTLNEKLQWLKLYDRKPSYTAMVDKVEAKKFVADIIGEEYIIPTLGVWDDANAIDFQSLPNQFVLKCTHDSHGLVICRDKTQLDLQDARTKLEKGLKQNYYYRFREWPYKNVKPRIIGEQYIEDETGFLTDYKFYCFHGKADCVLTCFDREQGHTKYFFFDRNWELKRYNKQGRDAPEGFTKPRPKGIETMFALAETLAKATEAPFVQVDMYNVRGKIYFGELTLYPGSGFDRGRLPETDLMFGNMLHLPAKPAN